MSSALVKMIRMGQKILLFRLKHYLVRCGKEQHKGPGKPQTSVLSAGWVEHAVFIVFKTLVKNILM